MKKNIQIALDGPAASGKSTVAMRLAKELNLTYIDTGAMYRAIALKAIRLGISPSEHDRLIDLLNTTEIDFVDQTILLDGENVNHEIRENVVSINASKVASIKEVRVALVKLQKKIANNKSVVMDGRDICDVVLPDANYKFFLTASPEERGKRRYYELLSRDSSLDITLDQIIEEIKFRDKNDAEKAFSPFKKSEAAIEINTTHLTVDEVIEAILTHIEKES